MYRDYDRYDDYDRYGDYDEPECQGTWDDCEGCELCVKETSTTRVVVARKAKGSVQPGDLVAVETGFTYQVGGPRMGYFTRRRIVGYGPEHGSDLVGTGRWSMERFAKAHPDHAPRVEARNSLYDEAQRVIKGEVSLASWEARVDTYEGLWGSEWTYTLTTRTYNRCGYYTMPKHTVWSRASVREAFDAAEAKRVEQARQEAKWARQKAERAAIKAAKTGDVVDYEGGRWTVGKVWSKAHYFSNMEYNGHLCDAEVRSYRTLTHVETGETCNHRV